MTETERKYTVGEVFVAGGLPTFTYNPRERLGLEDRLRAYLDERYRMLSLSGPTKTGKTVLLKSILEDPIWLSGGNVTSYDDFWELVADDLQLHTDFVARDREDDVSERETYGEGNAGVAKGGRRSRDGTTISRSDERSRSRSKLSAAREALQSNLYPLVVDDFHYIDQKTQLQIVRSLKELIFEGLPVILASVPHRAYDAVRVEKEMTGRVEQLPIPFWEQEELLGIAEAGFDILNVRDPDGAARRLSNESFQSPHLMQTFCREVCKTNGVYRTLDERRTLEAPDWESFFGARATATSKSAFDRLARGPRQRSDRKERHLRDGRVTDIYGLILAGIAHTGPLTELRYEELRGALREITKGDPPQRHEVTRVLEMMSEIARDEIEGEPVIDYDTDLSTLYISDPFFAYYLRWGSPEDE